jgi:hypothetical protein
MSREFTLECIHFRPEDVLAARDYLRDARFHVRSHGG